MSDQYTNPPSCSSLQCMQNAKFKLTMQFQLTLCFAPKMAMIDCTDYYITVHVEYKT